MFIQLVWTPFIWGFVKPKNDIIDNKAHWFHRYAVDILDEARRGADGWVMYRFMGVMIRDPHAHPMRCTFRHSYHHLFVIRR